MSPISPLHRNFSAGRVERTTSQYPIAAILSCADSRVAPEFAFDQGPGDLFVVRIAGNFANDDGLASLEYAVKFLGVPLVLVLGHSNCGAVSAAIKVVEDNAVLPGHLPGLVQSLKPAVEAAKAKSPKDLLAAAIAENVVLTVKQLETAQPLLASFADSGKVKVAGGVYDLANGKLGFCPETSAEGQPSKIALQRSAPADVERRAVKRAAERGIVQERARNGFKPPFFESAHHAGVVRIDDDPLFIDREYIHVEPLAAHRCDFEHPIVNRVRFGRDQNIPLFQNGRQAIGVDIFRVDEHLAGRQRKDRGIDVHRIGAAALDFMDPIGGTEVAPQPFDAKRVGDVAPRDEQDRNCRSRAMTKRAC